jgi:diaminohydroxyphosphoribosylaminopyrimidine deaminase/5-amino-6-(5-phosphoribosylamino)uracil reductase
VNCSTGCSGAEIDRAANGVVNSGVAEISHEAWMQAAIAEAERARGTTGDNPWVGCVIIGAGGELIAAGHTQGPGEDHAEILAMRRARALGVDLAQTTMYSTLEPCSFHGRTPACARAIVASGVPRIVTGIHDPNPRVDGLGLQILREGGLTVIEDVCARAIRHQLADWIFEHHAHDPLRRASALHIELGGDRGAVVHALCELYGVQPGVAERVVAQLGGA